MASLRVLHRVLLSAILAMGATIAGAREVSLQEAIERVQRETDGKVLSAETVTIGKRKIYRIKVLTRDGQVRVVQVSADD